MTNNDQTQPGFRLRKLDPSSAPIWREWQLIPKASINDVCLLSLNLNPYRIHANAWPVDAGDDYYDEFFLRLRVTEANSMNDPVRFCGHRHQLNGVRLSEFAAWALSIGWDIPPELAALASQVADMKPDTGTLESTQLPKDSFGDTASEADVTAGNDSKAELAALFDPVTVEVLEKMFPANGKWEKWADRAKRKGLDKCRIARSMYNPYCAAEWFLLQGEPGWDWDKCCRKLAKNLPDRSRDSAHLLTGEID